MKKKEGTEERELIESIVENKKSKVGSKNTLTEESIRVRDGSGGLVARPRLQEGGYAVFQEGRTELALSLVSVMCMLYWAPTSIMYHRVTIHN